jgi:5-methylcytosine-specific restriction endonuclease McrA
VAHCLGRGQELTARNHLAELGPYIPGSDLDTRLWLTRELDTRHFAAVAAARRTADVAKESLERSLALVPMESLFVTSTDGLHFALSANALWRTNRHLTKEQWLGAIAQATEREEARIKTFTTNRSADTRTRTAIPSIVRIEVWKRDGGLCVRCGSRERLEFDHIIPVAPGGW